MWSFKVSLASTILTFLLFAGGIGMETAYGQSDFYLEGKTSDKNSLADTNLKITKFEIQGNSSSYKQVCPSLQCKIDYKDRDASFIGPTTEVLGIAYDIDFRIQDDITHADFGPKKKELVERYNMHVMGCTVDDIIEDNGQEIYICHHTNNIMNEFDGTRYYLNTTTIYDAKNEVLKITSNFTGDKL